MENELVANERTQWVRRYAMAIQMVGILVILSAGLYGFWLMWSVHNGALRTQKLICASIALHMLNTVAYGVAVLALAQLVRYVFGQRRERRWLLRFAPTGLVLWAALEIPVCVLGILAMAQFRGEVWSALVAAISTVCKVLVLISLAMVLRRALPIVEESRSLV
jgi:hypothetical protein